MSQNWLLPFGRRILLLNVDVRQLRDFSADFFFVFLFFAKFLATLDPNMHETKCRGARDLRVVKFSASYGPWRSQKRPKTKKCEIFRPTFFSFGRLNFHIPCGRRILLLKKEPLLHFFLHPGFWKMPICVGHCGNTSAAAFEAAEAAAATASG